MVEERDGGSWGELTRRELEKGERGYSKAETWRDNERDEKVKYKIE